MKWQTMGIGLQKILRHCVALGGLTSEKTTIFNPKKNL
jgi:hypothetical protein